MVRNDTTTCRIELRNGFKFHLTESAVHKILGIPCGGFPAQTKPSKQIVYFMNTFLETTKQTPEHLLSMLSENISEEAFSRIFMLLVLSILIAPRSKGVLSKNTTMPWSILSQLQNTIGVSLPCLSWFMRLPKCSPLLGIRGQN